MPSTVDFVSTFSAPTNGTSDCSAAWGSLNTYLMTHNDVIMTVPAHTYSISSSVHVASGVPSGTKLQVQATGATFTTNGGAAYFLGGDGTSTANSPQSSALVQTALAGSSQLTLKTIGDSSLFTNGLYILITALDVSGGVQYPVNPFYFEYVQIATISGATVNLQTPLKYTYSSTYPSYNTGSGSNPNDGGPATIYVLPPSWNLDIEYIGCTFADSLNQQIVCNARKAKFTNCSSTNTLGLIPSQNQEYIWDNCNLSTSSAEVDKLVEVFTAGNGTQVQQLHFQSASITQFNSTGGLTVNQGFNGTARNCTIDSAVISSVRFGPTGFGRPDSFIISNSSISSVTAQSVGDSNVSSLSFTFDPKGLITVPIAALQSAGQGGAVRWATPGGRIIFSGGVAAQSGSANDQTATIIGITSDGTNTFVRTTPFGSWWDSSQATSSISVHPAPFINFSNCTGCADVIDFSQTGAQGKPVFSYSKRTYTGDNSGNLLKLSTAPAVSVWGHIVSVRVNVSQAYTGTQLTLLANIFNADRQINPDGTASTWDPVIDLKTPGVRTITAKLVTGNVGSDSLTIPGNVWFSQGQQLTVNHDVSGENSAKWPIVEIEIITDQTGVFFTAPLGLRMH